MESELSINRRIKSDKVRNLENDLNRLEEELRKIGAFKNELPLSMMLLTDAINVVRDEIKSNSEPILEEFIPLKSSEEKKDNVVVNITCKDKKDWMSSFQLWNNCESKPNFKLNEKKSEEQGRRIGVPFKESDLSLAPPQIDKCGGDEIDLVAESGANERLSPKVGGNARKQRRCWSFELHRRFINALEQLGGAQVATPKAIRERMQVDGLTNDEVKSHLQKYRLHNRRVSSTSSIQPPTSKQSNSKSDSPHGPLHLPGSSSRCTSLTGGDGVEDEDDEKSESHSWKSHTNLPKSDHS